MFFLCHAASVFRWINQFLPLLTTHSQKDLWGHVGDGTRVATRARQREAGLHLVAVTGYTGLKCSLKHSHRNRNLKGTFSSV